MERNFPVFNRQVLITYGGGDKRLCGLYFELHGGEWSASRSYRFNLNEGNCLFPMGLGMGLEEVQMKVPVALQNVAHETAIRRNPLMHNFTGDRENLTDP